MPDNPQKTDISKLLNKTPVVADPATTGVSPDDPCTQNVIPATAICGALAVAEGNTKYTQGQPPSKITTNAASGKYQIQTETATDQIMKIRKISNRNEAKALWLKCRQSAAPECQKLQDDVCASYSNFQGEYLKSKGFLLTGTNRYLAWNQGHGGAEIILKAAAANQPVTNTRVLERMKAQTSWAYTPDAKQWIKNMQGHIQPRGYPI